MSDEGRTSKAGGVSKAERGTGGEETDDVWCRGQSFTHLTTLSKGV